MTKREKCSFCFYKKVIKKYDADNNITNDEAIKYNIDPYLYELKFSYSICKDCRKLKSPQLKHEAEIETIYL